MGKQREIVRLILERVNADKEKLKYDFKNSINEVGVRYAIIDDLLPYDMAIEICKKFPAPHEMRMMNSFREKKYTSKDFDKFDDLMRDITFAIQDPSIVSLVDEITGIENQIPDSRLYAGGLSLMKQGHYLSPHIDNSHDSERKLYRTLNLLYYVTDNWSAENGGNLELWDKKVLNNVTLVSKFNRLILMETNPWSWHSVNEILSDGERKCVSNYYFSQTAPAGGDYFHITAFSARPDQKILRLLSGFDAKIRQGLRKIVPSGLTKKDYYSGNDGA